MTRSIYTFLAIGAFITGTVFAFEDRFLIGVISAFWLLVFLWGLRESYRLKNLEEGKSTFSFAKKYIVAAVVFLAFGAFGFLRFELSLPEEEFKNFYGSEISWDGLVVEEVEERPNLKLVVFRPDGYSERILLQYRGTSKIEYGNRLWVRGVVKQPVSFKNFDYPNFLKTKNITAVIESPKPIVLKVNQGRVWQALVLEFKKKVASSIKTHIKEPSSEIVLGLLLGARAEIPKNILGVFQESGMSHLLSVSGFNITIIVLFLGNWVNKFFGVRRGFWLIAGLVFVFSLMAGFSASVIRASLMGGMLCLARSLQRPYGQFQALVLTGFVMVMARPLVLFYDVGFQLSFLATLGLIVLSPWFERRLKVGVFGGLMKEYVFTSLGAIVATLPLILYVFGSFNLMSIVANLLILPMVPLVMLVGFLSVVPVVGFGFGLVAHLLVGYMVLVASWVSGMEWAKIGFVVNYSSVVVAYAIFLLISVRAFVGFRKIK